MMHTHFEHLHTVSSQTAYQMCGSENTETESYQQTAQRAERFNCRVRKVLVNSFRDENICTPKRLTIQQHKNRGKCDN